MRKIEHIGIAVKNLDESNELFKKLLGVAHYKIEVVESEGVRTSFFRVGDVKIELLEATRPDYPICKFIEKKGEGIHHIAFDVEDSNKSIKKLAAQGFQPIIQTAKEGADNKMIAFLHPKSTNNILIELCNDKTKHH